MNKGTKAAIAVVVVVIVVVASVFILTGITHKSSTNIVKQPGTSFFSTSELNKTVGSGWVEESHFAAGEDNSVYLILSVLHLEAGSYFALEEQQISLSLKNVSEYLSSQMGFSSIIYSNQKTSSILEANYLVLPNITISQRIFSNISATVKQNSSIIVSTSQNSTSGYIFVNASGSTSGPKEGLFGYSGRYLVIFLYFTNTVFISEKATVSLFNIEASILIGVGLSVPSPIMSASEADKALGMSFNSSAYVYGNISNASSLVNLLRSLSNTSVSGLSGSTTSTQTGTIVLNQYSNNISQFGIAVFGNESQPTIAASGFATFKASQYSSAFYELINAAVSSNATLSSTYQSGKEGTNSYFYFHIMENGSAPGIYYNITVLVMLDGNSLILESVASPSVVSVNTMVSMASAQVSDM